MSVSKFYTADPWLKPFNNVIDDRINKCQLKERHLVDKESLANFSMGHHYYGLHRKDENWIFREWAPNATNIFIIGTMTGWKENQEYRMQRINEYGDWEIIP